MATQTTGLPACRFFAQGFCTKGAVCPFAHNSDIANNPSAVPCKFFLEGQCRYSRNCRFSHSTHVSVPDETLSTIASSRDSTDRGPKSMPSNAPPQMQLEEGATCGICYERLDTYAGGKRYGMLENCDHLFCLECIREWRKTASDAAKTAQKQNARCCPVCRVESFFVIPADRQMRGDDKTATQKEYKKNMDTIPCKFWDAGRGSCNFGNSCFYAHDNADGSRYVPPPLRIVASDAGTRVAGKMTLMDYLPSSHFRPA